MSERCGLRRKFASQFDIPDGGRYSNDWTSRIDTLLAEIEDAAERERLLREALEFYANSSDNYMKAQAALAGMSFEEFRVLAATQEEGVR